MFSRIFKNNKNVIIGGGRGGDGGNFLKKNKEIIGGGRGGDGGNFYLFFDASLKNINCDSYKSFYFSENGSRGAKVLKNGKCGRSFIIRLPTNYLFIDIKNSKIYSSKSLNTSKILILRGGRGGKGCFRKQKSSFNIGQTPNKYFFLIQHFLKFHLVFLGFSNSGKSTFFSNFLKFKKNKISVYSFTSFNFYSSFFKLKHKKFFILDNSVILNKSFFNFNFLFYKYSKFIIFLHFLNIFFLFNIIKNFKKNNSKIYKFSKKFFYKPRVLIFNKADLIKNIYLKKNIIFFIFKFFFNWNNNIFFNTIFFKKNFLKLLKKFFTYF